MLTGKETFVGESGVAATVLDFWRWSCSDLLDNTNRGMIAEFLVAHALGIDNAARSNWEPYDLLYGNIKIEVKSSAYVQSWEQTEPYSPRFDIHCPADGKRPSDLYIFSLLNEKDKNAATPLALDQWEFFVAHTSRIESKFGTQKSVSLSMVAPLSMRTQYDKLKDTVDFMGSTQ